jgi:hypothetical protein
VECRFAAFDYFVWLSLGDRERATPPPFSLTLYARCCADAHRVDPLLPISHVLGVHHHHHCAPLTSRNVIHHRKFPQLPACSNRQRRPFTDANSAQHPASTTATTTNALPNRREHNRVQRPSRPFLLGNHALGTNTARRADRGITDANGTREQRDKREC